MMWNSCLQEVHIDFGTDSTGDEVERPIKLLQDGAHTHNSLDSQVHHSTNWSTQEKWGKGDNKEGACWCNTTSCSVVCWPFCSYCHYAYEGLRPHSNSNHKHCIWRCVCVGVHIGQFRSSCVALVPILNRVGLTTDITLSPSSASTGNAVPLVMSTTPAVQFTNQRFIYCGHFHSFIGDTRV